MVSKLACVVAHASQTSSNPVCEAASISFLCAPNGLNELLEMRFKLPFNLIRKLIVALLTGQSWHVLKSWNTRVGAQNQDFGAVSQTDLTRSLDPSVAQARSNLVFCLFDFLLLFHVKFHLWT